MKNTEIERKFLVFTEKWNAVAKEAGTRYCQGYLSIDDEKVIRVRVAGRKGFLTIKGRSESIERPEYEYRIPVGDARALIQQFSKNNIEKTRYRVLHRNSVWEVDEFHGANQGLIIAEIELERTDSTFELPEWVREEVTGDPRYYNSFLSQNPFGTW